MRIAGGPIAHGAMPRALIETLVLLRLAYFAPFFALTDPGLQPILSRGIVISLCLAATGLISLWSGVHVRLVPRAPFRRRALIAGADSAEGARLRVEYDLYYIKHQSTWLDLWILFRTVWHVLAFKGR